MNCIEARRMVTPFVNKELSEKETEQFLKHIEQCEDCRDELDIYFTMYKAIDLLDSGAHHEFDFKKMLENEIRTAHRTIMTRKLTRLVRCVIILIAEVFLLLCIYTGYQMRRGELNQNAFELVLEHLKNFSFEVDDYEEQDGYQAIGEAPVPKRDWTDKSDIMTVEELLDKRRAKAETKSEKNAETETKTEKITEAVTEKSTEKVSKRKTEKKEEETAS